MLKTIAEQVRKRQTLLTVFAVLIILLGGIQVVDNPDQWWLIPSILAGVLAAILVFIYARVIFKILVSFIVMSFSTYYAFMLGSYSPDYGILAESWAISTTLVWFLNLALSYMMQSVRSRWIAMMIASVLQLVITTLLIDVFDNPHIAVALGAASSIMIFLILFKIGSFTAYRKSNMPSNVASDILTRNLRNAFEDSGWTFRDLRTKGNKGGYLVFKETAHYIHPVRMTQDFAVWNKSQLRYREKKIDKWLAAVAFKHIPLWRAKFAPIMPVLLDISNANGANGKVIGVNLPDTRKQMPFGVFPGRELNSSRENKSSIIDNFNSRFEEFIKPISDSQKNALKKISHRDISENSDSRSPDS